MRFHLAPLTKAFLFIIFLVPSNSSYAQDQNAYFETLASGPGVVLAKSCRDQDQLNADRHGEPVTYDSLVDAARTNVREQTSGDGDADPGPRYTFPAVTNGQLWFVFDMLVHPDFLNILGGLSTYKMFQFTSDGIVPVSDDRRIEIRTHFTITSSAGATAVENPGGVVDTRPYNTGSQTGYLGRIEPLNSPDELHFRDRFPYITSLGKWNRYWALVDLDSKEYSLWMADEDRNAVSIYDKAPVPDLVGLNGFWWEFDTSQSRSGPAGIFGWFRNLVVLHNVTPPFDKPLGANSGTPPTAPENLRLRD